MASTLEGLTAPGGRNPLWVISLFLALAEVTAGIAATQASGWIQGLFAVFAVTFPIAVGTVFFLFLWKKPYVLYAPKDYSPDTPVTMFVEAMTTSRTREAEAVDSALKAALDQMLGAVLAGAEASRVDATMLAEEALTTAKAEVASRSVSVRIAGFRPATETVEMVVDDKTTVQDLLDNVYFAIADEVPAYSYGDAWVLRNRDDGKTLSPTPTPGLLPEHGGRMDRRSLADAGIRPGARLEAVRVA